MASLKDFMVYFNEDNWRSDVEKVLENKWPVGEGPGKYPFEDVRQKVARTRAAYQAGLDLRAETEAAAKKAAATGDEQPDLNKALTPPEEDAVARAWTAQQPWSFIPAVQPNVTFRDRVYREFTARRVFLHSVETIQSRQKRTTLPPHTEKPIYSATQCLKYPAAR